MLIWQKGFGFLVVGFVVCFCDLFKVFGVEGPVAQPKWVCLQVI